LRARDEACIGALIWVEPERAKEARCRGGNANDNDHSKEFAQPMAFHVKALVILACQMNCLSF
jgi:hypothetical protein